MGGAGLLIEFGPPAEAERKQEKVLAPSSSGLGRRPLKAVARVRIPSGLRFRCPLSAHTADRGHFACLPGGRAPRTPHGLSLALGGARAYWGFAPCPDWLALAAAGWPLRPLVRVGHYSKGVRR